MTLRLVLRRAADKEITEAAAYYRQIAAPLGARFLIALDDALDKILANPLQYQRISARARRASIARFPYALIYTVSNDAVVVVACAHGRQNPRRWQNRE